MRIWFVINPQAGRVKESWLTEEIRREFPNDEVSFADTPPCRAEIVQAGDRALIVAVGGDGTVQRLLQTLGDPIPCPVGILPLGTSNDLARGAGIPMDLHEACGVLRQGRPRRTDLMEVNGIPFATAGGIGLPSAIAERANSLREGKGPGASLSRRLGRFVYIAAAVLELAGLWRPVRGRLARDPDPDRDASVDASAPSWAVVLISNQPTTGGFRACPDANDCDGQLDLFTIKAPRRRLRLGWVVLRTRLGRAAACREVGTSRHRQLTLVTPQSVPFLGDGEILLRARKFDIRVRPRALPLMVPVSRSSGRYLRG